MRNSSAILTNFRSHATTLIYRTREMIFSLRAIPRTTRGKLLRRLPDTFAHGRIVKMRQTGKGKGNAEREGFRAATGDILMVLDADLTMPPEDLPKFVKVLASGKVISPTA